MVLHSSSDAAGCPARVCWRRGEVVGARVVRDGWEGLEGSSGSFPAMRRPNRSRTTRGDGCRRRSGGGAGVWCWCRTEKN